MVGLVVCQFDLTDIFVLIAGSVQSVKIGSVPELQVLTNSSQTANDYVDSARALFTSSYNGHAISSIVRVKAGPRRRHAIKLSVKLT